MVDRERVDQIVAQPRRVQQQGPQGQTLREHGRPRKTLRPRIRVSVPRDDADGRLGKYPKDCQVLREGRQAPARRPLASNASTQRRIRAIARASLRDTSARATSVAAGRNSNNTHRVEKAPACPRAGIFAFPTHFRRDPNAIQSTHAKGRPDVSVGPAFLRSLGLFHEAVAGISRKQPSCARGDLNPHALSSTGT